MAGSPPAANDAARACWYCRLASARFEVLSRVGIAREKEGVRRCPGGCMWSGVSPAEDITAGIGSNDMETRAKKPSAVGVSRDVFTVDRVGVEGSHLLRKRRSPPALIGGRPRRRKPITWL